MNRSTDQNIAANQISVSPDGTNAYAWRLHPANIPSLQDACMSVIRSDQRLMDAVLLQADKLGLPPHIVDEILEEGDTDVSSEESCRGRVSGNNIPRANQNPDPRCPCRDGSCMAGFFPSSAVFINEHQVVLLDGKSGCLKRCVCTFNSDNDDGGDEQADFHFSDIEVIPEAFHRRWGGTVGSDRYVLRKDGAAMGVASGTLCIFPRSSRAEVRTTLRFRHAFPADNYVSLHLPRLIEEGIGADCSAHNKTNGNIDGSQSKEDGVLFVLARRTGRARHPRTFDLRRIYLNSGATIDVGEDVTKKYSATSTSASWPSNLAGRARRTTTQVSGPWENLPSDVQVQSFLDLGDDNVILLGSSQRDSSIGRSDTPGIETSLFRGSIGIDERGAPTVAWSKETIARSDQMKDVDDRRADSSEYLCIYSELSHGGEGGIGQKGLGAPFFVSANNGATWSQPGLTSATNILCGGNEVMPAVLTISSRTGKLFAFGYDPLECRAAERKRLLGSTGSKNTQKLQWPPLRVYQWRL